MLIGFTFGEKRDDKVKLSSSTPKRKDRTTRSSESICSLRNIKFLMLNEITPTRWFVTRDFYRFGRKSTRDKFSSALCLLLSTIFGARSWKLKIGWKFN